MNQITKIYNGNNIRIAVINNEKRMSAIDICRALGYKNARDSWKKLKRRNQYELKQYSVVAKLATTGGDNLSPTDGKSYRTDTLNLKGVIRLCMLANTPKAIQFRDWATEVLSREITGEYISPQATDIHAIDRKIKLVQKTLKKIETCFGSLDKEEKKLWSEYLFKAAGLPCVKEEEGVNPVELGLHKIDIWDLDKNKIN